MRLERISVNQFKIFLTYDDLNDRGYSKQDLWNNLPRANQLFQDMLHEASEELDMDLDGRLVVRVHMLQAQGMIIVVTQNEGEVVEGDDYIELKVTMDENEELMFSFETFESVIQVSNILIKYNDYQSAVYHYDNQYFVKIEDEGASLVQRDNIISIMSEYGSPSTMTSHVLLEYGNQIALENGIQTIHHYFN
ncbi:adapter protein MecA 1/2 [Alkalibacillus flavidus]|uniref:Adapter protein MecA 1/2 n=1 Tax=Alkalibacillus flavidus TaxID=546021 RepID=A0ABV2KS01_9BACI